MTSSKTTDRAHLDAALMNRKPGKIQEEALKLIKLGFWVIPIHPPGVQLGAKLTMGKEPIGKAWGSERRDENQLREMFAKNPGAGIGIGFGPQRAPRGGWLIDLEGDGPQATASLGTLLGGEIPDTPSWSSVRGSHFIFTAEGEQLLTLLAAAGAKEGSGNGIGVWKLPELPDLEIRIGGRKADGTVKQVQSVVPPTPGTDGKPRAWTVQPRTPVATLPQAAYAFLEDLAERKAIVQEGNGQVVEANHEGKGKTAGIDKHRMTSSTSIESRVIKYLDAIEPAIAGSGGHNKTFGAACRVGPGFDLSEAEAFRLLMEHYNPRCQPPWSESEIRHKVEDAYRNTEDRGWLLNGNGASLRNGSAATKNGSGHHGNVHQEQPAKGDEEKQSAVLMRLAGSATLFHDPERRAYAIIRVKEHAEIEPVRSRGFALWLKQKFWSTQRRPPSAQAFQDALGTLEAMAVHEGNKETVHVRIAGEHDRIYIDLGDDEWRIVEITPKGWSIKTDCAIRFRRPNGMRPLLHPKRGGSIKELQSFINCTDADFPLIVAWICASLRPSGPYTHLVATGEQGSAKSTTARMIRRLIDPHVSLLKSEPKDDQELVIRAVNNWVFALDNVSSIPTWMSDALCRLSTGGGHASRTLYTMDEVTYLEAQRPALITAIEDFVKRGDLADRCVFVHLPAIKKGARRTEKELWSAFDEAAPRILGAIYQIMSKALTILPRVKLPVSFEPRMLDFGLFGEAVSQAMGNDPNVFSEAYRSTRQAANEAAIEDSPVADAIKKLVAKREWTGRAKDLLEELSGIAGEKAVEKETKAGNWPKSPRGMSAMLGRLAPSLRAVDIQVELDDRRAAVPISLSSTSSS